MNQKKRERQKQHMNMSWHRDHRWEGVRRDYTAEEIDRFRPAVIDDYRVAREASERLWKSIQEKPFVRTFGALTGSQAVQMAKAGLDAIYLSGWQVAADMNQSYETYPDQSLYPSHSAPMLVRRLNNALARADLIERVENGEPERNYFLPIVADGEAGFGGPLHAFELTRKFIEAGAAGVHFEDQLAAEKKCGHMGGKVLVPTSTFLKTLKAARFAADVYDVPLVLIARTDADSARWITSDVDPYDAPFIDKSKRSPEGYFGVKNGLKAAIHRGLAYAPYADLLWFETSTPDLEEARAFAEAIHAKYPGKPLAYNCSPSFNWERNLDQETIAIFQEELSKLGYKFQFITLAGWHLINYHTFDFADRYRREGMTAYVELQNAEFAAADRGYTAAMHQREAGAGVFDRLLLEITGGEAGTLALSGSTEEAQFNT